MPLCHCVLQSFTVLRVALESAGYEVLGGFLACSCSVLRDQHSL